MRFVLSIALILALAAPSFATGIVRVRVNVPAVQTVALAPLVATQTVQTCQAATVQAVAAVPVIQTFAVPVAVQAVAVQQVAIRQRASVNVNVNQRRGLFRGGS
ncbi:MAG TPA: hypothetical protein VFE62_01610 [Gemmataceae bacterium]|nr:hypothetical protein [Gemmataceae bacterium]